uniref:putative UPF0481 protein At3g02645 n=1 Tax=Erigeron canadensis TaxID=72917 RepID=UPI001CB8D038|nr:putative UPF0481 protein At3g02645 [Erigeron canadensis]
MALTTTNFSSVFTEQRWVDQISKKFIREVTIDISDKNPICVFSITNAITIFKPEAYVPLVIGLGPYHHMDTHLYDMERYKVACAKSFLAQNHFLQGNVKFRALLIDKLQELDPVVRGCYHSYLDFDDYTLSWIEAIDGLFLLNVLQDYSTTVNLEGKKIARNAILSRDLLLLENQIPFPVLREISRTLHIYSSEKDYDEAKLFFMIERFCRANSPLEMPSISLCNYNETSHLHILDLMYRLMVNNGFLESGESSQDEEKVESQTESGEIEDLRENMSSACDNIGEITKLGMNFRIGVKILRPIQVIQDIPWDRILTITGLKSKNPEKLEGPVVEEIRIPSVSSLHCYAGISFRPTNEGMRGIKFVEEEAVLYLPVITLDVNSEVVLRNLVAYEIAMNYSHFSPSISQFVDLISGIIDKAEDVRMLKQNGIIKSKITNDQIAEIFNGMNKTTRSSVNKTVVEINNYYKKKLTVKAFKFVKKRLLSMWKMITRLLTVLLLLLLVLYSFCQFYGCPKLFGKNS